MTYMCDIYICIYSPHYHPNLYSLPVLFLLCHQTSGGDPSGLQSTGFHQVEKWISSGAAKDGEIQSGETVFGKRPGSK